MKGVNPLIGVLISFIVIMVGIYIISSFMSPEETTTTTTIGLKCQVDEDCVPATCCHPDSCVHKDLKPDCTGIFCTMECRPGTMDCGQGYCACVDNQCVVIWSE